MSYTVRRAALTAVRASISMPVGPTHRAVTVTIMEAEFFIVFPKPKSTSMPDICMGWHMGIRSGVFFAAMTAAQSAIARTSPFLMRPLRMRLKVSAFMRITPSATAVLAVEAFSETSTMRARPFSLKWVRVFMV